MLLIICIRVYIDTINIKNVPRIYKKEVIAAVNDMETHLKDINGPNFIYQSL
jgi:hypothetical protein